MNIAYNMDCLKAMSEMPDKYYDLAVVDPPYGDGTGGNPDRFNGSKFKKYNLAVENLGGVARKAEILPRRDTTHSERGSGTAPIRTGGTWAAKYGKKS